MKRDRIEVDWIDSTCWSGWRDHDEPAIASVTAAKARIAQLQMMSTTNDVQQGARIEMIPRACVHSVKQLVEKPDAKGLPNGR